MSSRASRALVTAQLALHPRREGTSVGSCFRSEGATCRQARRLGAQPDLGGLDVRAAAGTAAG
jgi:hypothetical protein